MKVISLYQPWATLMVLGLKTNETRSWSTKYRGLLGIHATKSTPKWCREAFNYNEVMQRALSLQNLAFDDLPHGQIIGAVKVVGMMETSEWEYENIDDTAPDEWWFGDYSVGRWAWLTESPIKFDMPIPAKGSQGFWEYNGPRSIQETVNAQTVHNGQLQIFG